MNPTYAGLHGIAVSHETIGQDSVVRFRYPTMAQDDLWTGTGELAMRMVRELGVEVRPWGSSSSEGESMVGWRVSRPLTDGELADLGTFVERVNHETLAERFRLRGPQEGEAPWVHLGISSDSETLKEWVTAHYRSCGITSTESLSEVAHGFDFRYCVLPVGEIRGESPYTNAARVKAYAEMMQGGIAFPPLVLAMDSLREGFHRKSAYAMVGQDAPCICFELD